MKKVILVNEKNKEEKEVNSGYSFDCLLLNFLVPLFRKDLAGLFMFLAYDLLAYVFWRDLGQVFPALMGLLILPLVYNKLYIAHLEDKGYRVEEITNSEDSGINFAA